MKIAYFVWEFPPRLVGGLGTYAGEITKKFAEMGHELNVFTMNDDSSLKTNETVMGGMTVHRPMLADASGVMPAFVDEELRKWGSGLKFFSDIMSYNLLSANKCVNQIAKQKSFDIVVCHDWLSAMGGVISKANLKKPLVFHVHSTEYGRSGGKGGSNTVKELEYSAAANADMIITVSYAMQQELNTLKFPLVKTRVMWNGVDERKYDIRNIKPDRITDYRRSLGIADDEKMVFFAGRLTWVKGIDSLVRAMPSILAKAPKTKLVILGRGEMTEEVRNMVGQFSLEKNVVLLDRWVEEDERIMLYASCDVACAPSRYEPFGIISLEGMGMSKPVVVGVGGLREAVLDCKTGFYCNPDDPESIAGRLVDVLSDEKLAKQMGTAGRERVEKLFTWGKIAADTIKLYETLL